MHDLVLFDYKLIAVILVAIVDLRYRVSCHFCSKR